MLASHTSARETAQQHREAERAGMRAVRLMAPFIRKAVEQARFR
ncbi:hypothetical protein OM427_06280 [Halomonas sp. 18H]|nr:hypothetical protein [Halomonas sp. 18H]